MDNPEVRLLSSLASVGLSIFLSYQVVLAGGHLHSSTLDMLIQSVPGKIVQDLII